MVVTAIKASELIEIESLISLLPSIFINKIIKSSMLPPTLSMTLSKNSPAVAKLHEKFSSGQLTGKEQPKDVWLSDPIFQQHKLENFRTCYNKVKKEYSTNSTNGMA